MRRRPVAQPEAAEVDAERAEHRARQLRTRLRGIAPDLGPGVPDATGLRPRIQRALADAEQAGDPFARLSTLLDAADEIRPLLPADVVTHTLPESFNRWRV